MCVRACVRACACKIKQTMEKVQLCFTEVFYLKKKAVAFETLCVFVCVCA